MKVTILKPRQRAKKKMILLPWEQYEINLLVSIIKRRQTIKSFESIRFDKLVPTILVMTQCLIDNLNLSDFSTFMS